jgi:hypothetical protein
MKKYTIEIIEDKTGTHINRDNEGFTIFEIHSFVSLILDDLKSIIKKGFDKELKLEDQEKFSKGKKAIKKSKVVKTLK